VYLRSKAKTGELIRLTNYSNPTVRCYAFWALVIDKHKVDLNSIIAHHLSDKKDVTTLFGCIMETMNVIDFFIEAASGNLM
jgi:hypothetical protein